MTMEMVPDANAVSSDVLAPYRAALDAALDAAAEARLPLDEAALVLLTRGYPSYVDDAPTLVQLGVEWVTEVLWCAEDAAVRVAARPIADDGGDAIWVPRTVVELYFTQSGNAAPLELLQAAGKLLPILLLGPESGLFFAETERVPGVLP